MNKVFNVNKTPEQYAQKSGLFFGPEPGLFDTANKHYPEIWKLYKTMKSLDWSEDEFDFEQCRLDFETCPRSVYEMMIYTIAWQWEADSSASRSIAPVLAPFITDSSLWAAWQRISDNEVIHAATYSEIVQMSFKDPEKVFKEVLEVKESLERLDTVAQIFSEANKASHEYALGLIGEEEAYDKVLMLVIALLFLERVQFMASFAITFTICKSHWFQALGKAVGKIAQDELDVHSELDKAVLKIELATERGRASFERQREKISKLAHEIIENEFTWTDWIFSEGRDITGANAPVVKKWVLFNAGPVFKFLDIKTDLKFPTANPMLHLEDWLDISKVQATPQEQDNNQYKVGVIVRDDDNAEFDSDF